jgi:hypothetical protein
MEKQHRTNPNNVMSVQSKTQTWAKRLDAGIRNTVLILHGNGIETFESCQGGSGHCFFEPTVRFHGNQAEGLKAVSIALNNGLKVLSLRRYWSVEDGELKGDRKSVV